MSQMMKGQFEHWSLALDKDNILWLKLDRKDEDLK